jgi:hypothetical protein
MTQAVIPSNLFDKMPGEGDANKVILEKNAYWPFFSQLPGV